MFYQTTEVGVAQSLKSPPFRSDIPVHPSLHGRVEPHQLGEFPQPRHHPSWIALFPSHLHGPQKPYQDAFSVDK